MFRANHTSRTPSLSLSPLSPAPLSRGTLLALLAAAACVAGAINCGDGGSGNPDASTKDSGGSDGNTKPDTGGADAAADAPFFNDAASDATTDSASDATSDAQSDGGSTQSRVWAIGDFVTDTKSIAGAFTDGDTLPFGPSNPPTLTVPGGTSVLGSGTGYNVSAMFDATPDGSKIAFVGDLTQQGRLDLYVANGDGTSPILLVQGQTNVEIASVAISPDGTKIAYTADVTINGGYDLYVTPTTANPTPVKITSTPSAAQDVFYIVTWSADSKYVAFSADLTTDAYDQAYCVDTTVTTPTAVELLAASDIAVQAGTHGVRGALQFDAADNVYYRARVTLNSPNFQLFKSTPDAQTRTDVTTTLTPARGDNSIADIGAFILSPDGTSIVVAADAPTATAYDLYTAKLANPTPLKLTSAAAGQHPDFTTPMWLSPDGNNVAFVANFGGGRNEPYIAAMNGTGAHRLVAVATTCNGCATPDATEMQWTVDGQSIYLMGDITVNNDTKLFKVDPTMTDQTPTLAVDVPANGDLFWSLIRPK